MLLPTITEALANVGMTRRDVEFTCSGSADYLTGGTFTFVQMLEAAGAWPPISESHVEMDGAWALYEAWVRLQHGDVDVALVFASGRASLGASLRETLTFQLDPYYLAPIGADYVSLAALQAQAVLAQTGKTEKDLAEIVARAPPRRERQPERGGVGRRERRRPARRTTTWSRRCARTTSGRRSTARPRSCSSPVTGRARCATRPAWIAGIDHRVDPHYPGVRDLAVSPSAAAGGGAGRRRQGWRRGRGAVGGLHARRARARRRARPRRRRRDQPVGRRARREPGDGHRPGPHRRGVPPSTCSAAATGRSVTRRRVRACSRTSCASLEGTSR